jgi:3-mercaptopyruvate sulfurtransferase SseA
MLVLYRKVETQMNYFRMLLIMTLLVAPAVSGFGGDYGSLTGAELKAMMDRNEPGLMIIDSRSQNQYEESHIKGAISIPLSEMEQDTALPKAAKETTLVFYCSGTT